MPTSFTQRRFEAPRNGVENKLRQLNGGSLTVNSLEWSGAGPEGFFLVEEDETTQPDTPITGVEQKTRHFVRFTFLEIRDEFFSGVPVTKFETVTAEVNTTIVTFFLGLEE